ncbi:hypothetical protein C0991_012515 [Blastosporella zonata]|nr:hypothetical protein C0991_012515 [Blastosporella zonata]
MSGWLVTVVLSTESLFPPLHKKGKYVSTSLNNIAKDQHVAKAFKFKNFGSLAYIGDWYAFLWSVVKGITRISRKAIYDRPGSGDGFMTKESGRLAWLLWRSAYFTMTLSVKNKILVPFYWFLTWIFGRDLTRF